MKLLLPLILSLVLPLFVAAFVPSRNNLHGLLSCENYDSSTIRVTLSSLDSTFEDGFYSPSHHRNSDFRIKQSLKFQQTCRGWTTFCSIHHQVLLIHSFKIMFRWHSNVNWQNVIWLRPKRQPCYSEQELKVVGCCCWLLLVVGCWLLVVGCCCPTVLFFFFSSTHPFFSLSLFFFFQDLISH